MAMDDISVLQWAIGGVAAAGSTVLWILYMKTNAIEDAHTKHVLHVQETYAKTIDMNAGFTAATAAAAITSAALNAKMDKTQDAVHAIGLVQATQAANIENMDKNLKSIADTIKEKAG